MSSKNVEGAYPLSPIQQGMLFHSLYAPDAGLYVARLACTLEQLDVAAFERAWQQVVARHPILRTAFAWEKLERPLQVVGRQVRPRLEQHDWREQPADRQAEQLGALLEAERVRGFKLSKAPLMRLTLLRTGAETYQFVWTYHHILLDGWSVSLVLGEVLALYAAFRAGRDLELEQPRPFRDYITWLQRQDLAAAEAFWRETLAGFSAPTPLAIDLAPGAAPDVATGQAEQSAVLSDTAGEALRSLARRQRLTLNTLVQGAWALLLSRYSGAEDVVFGTTVSGRPAALAGVEQMVGLFINTLPTRVSVPPDAALGAWLHEIHAGHTRLRQYEYTPLTEIHGWSAVPRALPLFESLVVFENHPSDTSLERHGVRPALPHAHTTQWTNYPLALVVESGARLLLRCIYHTRRFDAAAIGRLLGHYRTLLEGMLARPEQRLADLPLLTPAEQHQLLVAWNETGADHPAVACAHQLFEAQAERTPSAVALVFQDQHLTYRELNRRANQLAQHLRSLGVRAGSRVALCMQRCPELIVGLLATWKAGGVYVPLDPAYPSRRLAWMLADAQVSVLLSAAERRGEGERGRRGEEETTTLLPLPLSPSPPLPLSASVVDLITDWPTIAREPATNPDSGVTPDNLAYVIYTSGSTGAPKGVMVPHRALAGNALDFSVHWGLGPGGRMLALVSISFDASLEELLPPLISGATLAVPDTPTELLGSRLAREYQRHAITLLHLPAPFWHQWVGQLSAEDGRRLAAVRGLFVGGDRIAPDKVRAWANALGRDIAFVNGYGPTEAAITATVYASTCATVASAEPAGVPIGRPAARHRIYLLDRHMRPVPVGVPGELYIGGDLAWGYQGRPDLTAERFVPNPFAENKEQRTKNKEPRTENREPDTNDETSQPVVGGRWSVVGGRLYRTGDLARYRPDGTIEFLGRGDDQVKLRGFRLEPGEIAATLAQHPGVRDACVVVREDAPGEKRLVAYVVPTQEQRTKNKEQSSEEPRTENREPTTDSNDTVTGQQGDNVTARTEWSEITPSPLHPLTPSAHELRAFLKDRLPDYMVPSAFVALEALPLTPGGKLDRQALPAPGDRGAAAGPHAAPRTEIERAIAAVWQAVLGVERVGVDENFFDLGGHSLRMLQVQGKLREALGRDIPMVDLFRYPTVSALAAALSPPAPERARPAPAARAPGSDPAIAIVGMRGRFPGAEGVEAFWQNLRDGVESIRFFSDDELLAAGASPALLRQPNYVKAAGVLDDVESFDAAFFGYTPGEAEVTDPQQRLFLECAWHALEHAGYDPAGYPGPIGVFGGIGMNTYLANLYTHPDLLERVGVFQAALGNEKDHLTTRVSYKLNLRGPSVNVQTSCSTSLTAVHLACRSLLAGECTMALAGGVAVKVARQPGYIYQEGGISSPDGHCRAFDAQAGGTVSGSGVGVVVLKRLADALSDGDTIYAVIKGSAINNDGSLKVGYTAPSVEGQAQVIAEALAVAGVAPETIGYVEAHGTGTRLGDPIEVAALAQVFGAGAGRGSCALGSVKTNIGHLDSAAGVAGLIKATLALHHRQIPPSLHYQQPNPQIDFANSPFYVNTRLAEWPANGRPRRAGVSSFGVGGTNVHLVLEEAPPVVAAAPAGAWQVLVLSARSGAALDRASDNLAQYLRQHPEVPLADVAYTLQVGRHAFDHRRVVVCRGHDEAAAALEARQPQRVPTGLASAHERPVVFLFPGGGAQYLSMGRELYQAAPVFRAQVDRCAEILVPHLGLDIRDVLYADHRPPTTDHRPPTAEGESGRGEEGENRQSPSSILHPPSSILHPPSSILHPPSSAELTRTSTALPALFAVEYALARLWMAYGLEPQAMLGHSLGEYVAACLAGVFSLEDALALVALRGRLFEQLPAGAMLNVSLPESDVRALLGPQLAVAAINGPRLCVVSGPAAAIDELEQRLKANNVECQRVHIDVAAHSAMVTPILEPFTQFVATLRLHPPRIAFLSNVTGTWISADEATDPRYWARHLRQPVRFADGVAELLRNPDEGKGDPDRIVLEVGPGRTLSTLVRQQLDPAAGRLVLTSLRHPRDRQPDEVTLLTTLGRLWLAGARVNWPALAAHERRRVPLPLYPFERRRYWVEPRPPGQRERPVRSAAGKISDIADWFHVPWWKRTPLPRRPKSAGAEAGTRWLVLVDDGGWGAGLAQRLEQHGHDVIAVRMGAGFARDAERAYTIDPRDGADYGSLVAGLRAAGWLPQTIVHCWSMAAERGAGAPAERFARAQDLGYYSLLWLAQALAENGLADPAPDARPLRLALLSSGLHPVTEGETVWPERASALGPCKIIPQEYPNITCQAIDQGAPDTSGRALDQLIAELSAPATDMLIAYRGGQRWAQTFEPLPLDRHDEAIRPLRERGVYLITGGLGTVGLLLAEHLADTLQARLALVGRTGLPARDGWDSWLAQHPQHDPVSRQIGAVLALERLGAEVLVIGADVADEAAMRSALAQIHQRFGALHGVIHAAGITSGAAVISPINTTGRAASEAQFHPKAHGVYVLENVLRDMTPDFCLLFSSNAAVLGGLGFAAYAAANLFMDAFAASRAASGATAWISANWDSWPSAAPAGPDAGVRHTSMEQYAMTAAEALDAFERLVRAAPGGQVVVSTGDLDARLRIWTRREFRAGAENSDHAAPLHPRPQLEGQYVAPTNEIERKVAASWQAVLGIEQVGIHDNFFELGGHSLLATQLMSRLRDAFQVELPLQSLFELPTVAELAALIAGRQGAQDDEERLARLVAEIQQLPPDEVLRLLAAEQQPAKKEATHE